MLAEHAQSMPETAPIPALCQSYYEKGLLEWRVSTQAVTSFLGRLPKDNWLEVSYSAFVADPLGTSERLTDFLHLTPEQTVRDFTQQNVRRCSESRDGAELTQLERRHRRSAPGAVSEAAPVKTYDIGRPKIGSATFGGEVACD